MVSDEIVFTFKNHVQFFFNHNYNYARVVYFVFIDNSQLLSQNKLEGSLVGCLFIPHIHCIVTLKQEILSLILETHFLTKIIQNNYAKIE